MNKEEIRQCMGPEAMDSVDTVRGLSSKLSRLCRVRASDRHRQRVEC